MGLCSYFVVICFCFVASLIRVCWVMVLVICLCSGDVLVYRYGEELDRGKEFVG